MANDNKILNHKQRIDLVKYRWYWLMLSAILIVPGILAMIYLAVVSPDHTPLKVGIDFKGGTMLQYGFDKEISKEDISKIRTGLTKIGIENPVIQIQEAPKITEKKGASDIKSIASIRTRFLNNSNENNEVNKVNDMLKNDFGSYTLLQVNQIGPTLGKELFRNAVIALLLAFAAIVIYLAVRFRLDYAIIALLSLVHDALFVCGLFAILGLLFNVEVDALFITAVLTVIGFSVHDTIVVFDRIRENSKFLSKKKSFNEIVNASVNQTLARSINTSFTAMITLAALYFFGGSTTKDFVLAMLLGIAIGTYSSIFFASTILAMWREKAVKTVRV